ncbi:hypothetical protein AUC68_09910 [Methyloceanibacter methanicus]|uniref:Uncharacterized protein n=1 Tax=Methyloceanibacter methanicus TaxID=1774968 RepID=A0A1E3VYT9_9HYPH|nr:hypothetical protein [Methyloceanibacter methanicus]ODR98692.1 hypothetical protein AUC68_09910 [Methyloceanibacter methanicus]
MRCAIRFLPAALAAVSILVLALLTAPRTVSAEPVEIDNAGLVTMLQNLGYEPVEQKYPNGDPYQRIKGSAPDLNWTADLAVNPNSKLVWLEMDFWGLNENQKFPYDVLLEALERNFNLGTVRFIYLKRLRKLRLAGSLPNRDVTPVQIRKLIDEAVNEARQTQHLWNPNKWRVDAAQEQPAEEPDQGTPAEPEAKAAAGEPEEPAVE